MTAYETEESSTPDVQEMDANNIDEEEPKEEVPLNKTETDSEIQKEDYTKRNEFSDRKKWRWLIVHDKEYRHKFFRTLCLSWSFIAFGWLMGQTGPSLLDLKIITSTTLEKAAAFLTGGSIGYLTGSLISGFLHNKIHGDLLLFICAFWVVVMTTIIPWCSIYELMIAAMFLRHIFLGAWDTVGNAELIQIWGDENMSYMQALHFCFGFGGILSPLATAPFLITPQDDVINSTTEHSLILGSSTSIPITQNTVNVSHDTDGAPSLNSTNDFSLISFIFTERPSSDIASNQGIEHPTSMLYIAYIISSCIAATAACWFFISYTVSKKREAEKQEAAEEKVVFRKLPLASKIIILINLMFLMGFYVAVEETTMSFLTTFCVKQFHWSKADGSYATSAFWASFAFGRFLGIFVIQRCTPSRMISSYILLLIASFSGLLLTSSFNFSEGIWIFIPISGFAMSVIFATVFTWTENELLPVTGKISSLFLIAASTGGMVNPLIVGSVMDTVTPMFFCYLLLGESVGLLCLYFLASFLSKRMDKRFGKLNKNNHCVDPPAEKDIVL